MNKKQYVMLAGAVLVASFFGGALSAFLLRGAGVAGDRLVVQSLEVRGRRGGPEILLGADAMGAAVRVYGQGANPAILLNVNGMAATVAFYDQSNSPRIGMGVFSDGSGLRRLDTPNRAMWKD